VGKEPALLAVEQLVKGPLRAAAAMSDGSRS